MTLTFEPKVDRFMSFLRGPLMAIYIEIGSFVFKVFKISSTQVWYRTNGRKDGQTCSKHYASGQSRLSEA